MRKLIWIGCMGLIASPANGADPTGWVHAQFNAFQVAGITILEQFFSYNNDTHMYRALGNALLEGHWVDPQAGVFEPNDLPVFCEDEPIRIMVPGAVGGGIEGDTLSHAEGTELLEDLAVHEFSLDGEAVPLIDSPVRRVNFGPRPGQTPDACFPDESGEEICFANWGWSKTYASDIMYLDPGEYEVQYTQNWLHCSWLDFPPGEEPPPWHPWWGWNPDACGQCAPAELDNPWDPFVCTITTPLAVLECSQ